MASLDRPVLPQTGGWPARDEGGSFDDDDGGVKTENVVITLQCGAEEGHGPVRVAG
jgi:hypothetical protein